MQQKLCFENVRIECALTTAHLSRTFGSSPQDTWKVLVISLQIHKHMETHWATCRSPSGTVGGYGAGPVFYRQDDNHIVPLA